MVDVLLVVCYLFGYIINERALGRYDLRGFYDL